MQVSCCPPPCTQLSTPRPAAQSEPCDPSNLLEAARASPACRILAFVADWSAVDHLRARVDAAGLSDQIHIHHLTALTPLCPSRAA